MKIGYPNSLIPDTIGLDKYEDRRPAHMLQKDFVFTVDGKAHTVPSGLEFDWASVPRGLWNIFPPYDPAYAGPSLIHDWLYGGEFVPRAMADRYFLEAMKQRGVSRWKRGMMYAAVRMFGNATYKRHTRKSIMKIRALSDITSEARPLWERL